MKRAGWCVIGVTLVLAGCSSTTDYAKRLDELMPPTWTQLDETGRIESSGCDGPKCGELDRKYEIHIDTATTVQEVRQSLTANGCTVQQAGNGLSSDCDDVHLAISFATGTVTVAMTRR